MLVRFAIVAVVLFALLAACQPKPQEQVPPTPSPALQVAPDAAPDTDAPAAVTEEGDTTLVADEAPADEAPADEVPATE